MQIGRLWGIFKQNPSYSYRKLYGSLFSSKKIEKVCGKKFVYRFVSNPKELQNKQNNPNIGAEKFKARKLKQCHHCNFVFYNRQSRNQHAMTKHDGVSYICKICHKQYASKKDLSSHIIQNHKVLFDVEGILYNCKNCDKSFTKKEELRWHIYQEHNLWLGFKLPPTITLE